MAYTPNPALVQAIRQRTSDPSFQAELLATALAESGGRLDAVGDNGNSGGPYQENSAGRGHNIPMAQRFDPVASTDRAFREFSALRLGDPGAWAARAQRPLDPEGYAAKVRNLMPIAQQILGSGGGGGSYAQVGGASADTGGSMAMALSPQQGRLLSKLIQRNTADMARGRRPSRMRLAQMAKIARSSQGASQAGAGYADMGAAGPMPQGGPGYWQGELAARPAANVAFGAAPDDSWANALGEQFGLSVSTYRDPAHNAEVGGSKTSRHMVHGGAGDFSGSPEAMRKLADYAIRSGRYAEVFYDPLRVYWDNGHINQGGIGGHSDHVHLSYGIAG